MGAEGSCVSAFCLSIGLYIQLNVINLALRNSSSLFMNLSSVSPGGRNSIALTSASPVRYW